jgi:RNA methyltransferase, TrmH family
LVTKRRPDRSPPGRRDGSPDRVASRVRAARRLAKRAARQQQRQFLAEGPQAVREALRRPGTVTEVFATGDLEHRHPELRAVAGDAGLPWHLVSETALASLAETVTPQGVVAVCGYLDLPVESVLSGAPALVAACVSVRDPGNAGTVIRCADAAGADAVLLSGSSVDVYNGKAVRASAGSLFHLPICQGPAAPDAVRALRSAGLRVLAADAGADLDLDAALDAGILGQPVAWLFGNESWGLPKELLALADAGVRVPIFGRAESLNLATAAAVCLYATARAQRGPGGCRS